MKRTTEADLRQELRAAGARDSEIGELTAIAAGLRRLPKAAVPGRIAFRWKVPLFASGTAIAGLALGMALVIFSQGALPGSWLYPVQKISDNTAVALHPNYRGAVMMKRADQVKQLVADNASAHDTLAALDDYQSMAAAYKSGPANYALFDYCKADLQQAASEATGPERAAINKTLVSLQNV